MCTPLATTALPVGMFADSTFPASTYQVPSGCRMLLFSDGAYEFTLPDGRQFTLDEFVEMAIHFAGSDEFSGAAVLDLVAARTADGVFDDDCSVIAVDFG